jgi:tetratricopeptide (TPR) repeat protein
MGYRDEARRVVDQTARDVKPFSANLVRATLAVEEGDWSNALRLLRAARAVADPAEKETAERRIALVARSLGDFDRARTAFPTYQVDDDMWRMWNGRALSAKRVDALASDPVALWHTTKMYFLARTLLNDGRSADLVRLYDRRFSSPEELNAIVHGGSPEVVMALRDVGRRGEAERMTKLRDVDARRIESRGRVPFEFYFERSQFLAAAGRREEAIAALEKAVRLGWFYNNEPYSFRDIGQEPTFRDIRSDRRFERIRAYFARHLERERREAQLLPA